MPRHRRRLRRSLHVLVPLLVLTAGWLAAQTLLAPPTWSRQEILDAIRHVESGGRPNPPDGDGGLAIGPYQIHRVYWEDAVTHVPELRTRGYQACRERAYAERVIDAYMRRWVPDAWRHGEAETIARVHNGGPQGAAKASTDRYWRKVHARLTGDDGR